MQKHGYSKTLPVKGNLPDTIKSNTLYANYNVPHQYEFHSITKSNFYSECLMISFFLFNNLDNQFFDKTYPT